MHGLKKVVYLLKLHLIQKKVVILTDNKILLIILKAEYAKQRNHL